jgi:drug/metabolite transporter (DMT)-like permease
VASKQKLTSVAALFTGALVWGLMWNPYRVFLSQGVSGDLATLLTYAIALALGLLLMGPVWKELPRAGWWGIALLAASGWTNYGYVLAILKGEVMRVMLLFYLAPLWTVIFAYFLLGEKLNRYGYAIIALSLTGALIMLWRPELGLPLPQNQAELIGLTAGMGFAMQNVLVRRMQNMSVNFKAAIVWLGTTSLPCLVLLFQGKLLTQIQNIPIESWWLILLIGVVLYATGIVVQFGLTHLPANQAIVIFISELVFAAVSSYFLAHETLGAREIVGAILIVSASLLSEKMHPEGEPP